MKTWLYDGSQSGPSTGWRLRSSLVWWRRAQKIEIAQRPHSKGALRKENGSDHLLIARLLGLNDDTRHPLTCGPLEGILWKRDGQRLANRLARIRGDEHSPTCRHIFGGGRSARDGRKLAQRRPGHRRRGIVPASRARKQVNCSHCEQ